MRSRRRPRRRARRRRSMSPAAGLSRGRAASLAHMSSGAAAYRKFQERGGVADLSARVKLALTGADRVRYLNGQVTSNVQKLAEGHTQPACVTTNRGKLCAEIM